MKNFFKYQIQPRIARSAKRIARSIKRIVQLGIALMPNGPYKDRLLEKMWEFDRDVRQEVSGDTSRHRKHTTRYEDLCQ